MLDEQSYQLLLEIVKDLPPNYEPEAHGFPGVLSDDDYFSESYCYALSNFIQSGRNLFYLAPELVSSLDQKPIDEILLEDMRFPFDSFYIHFGSEANIKAPDYFGSENEPFEHQLFKESNEDIHGAFITVHKEHDGSYQEIDIMLVPKVFTDTAYSHTFYLPCHDQGGKVRKTVKNKVLDIFNDAIYRNPFQDDLDNEKLNKSKFAGGINWHQAKKDWKPSTKNLMWEPAFEKALRIIFNAILHIDLHRHTTQKSTHSGTTIFMVSP